MGFGYNLRNIDLYNILALKTHKVVVIEDRWLGLIKYVATFGTAVYFLIYQMWQGEGYLDLSHHTGHAEFEIGEPDVLNRARELSYCS